MTRMMTQTAGLMSTIRMTKHLTLNIAIRVKRNKRQMLPRCVLWCYDMFLSMKMHSSANILEGRLLLLPCNKPPSQFTYTKNSSLMRHAEESRRLTHHAGLHHQVALTLEHSRHLSSQLHKYDTYCHHCICVMQRSQTLEDSSVKCSHSIFRILTITCSFILPDLVMEKSYRSCVVVGIHK